MDESVSVPESFEQSMRDCEEGRTADMELLMNAADLSGLAANCAAEFGLKSEGQARLYEYMRAAAVIGLDNEQCDRVLRGGRPAS